MKSQFARFVIGGGINTLITYGLFLVLSSVMPVTPAYTITYAVGIALAYFINSLLVFKRAPSVATAAIFPIIYGIQYLYGLALLSTLIDRLDVPKHIAMLIVIITSIPLTFILTRVLMHRRSARPRE